MECNLDVIDLVLRENLLAFHNHGLFIITEGALYCSVKNLARLGIEPSISEFIPGTLPLSYFALGYRLNCLSLSGLHLRVQHPGQHPPQGKEGWVPLRLQAYGINLCPLELNGIRAPVDLLT